MGDASSKEVLCSKEGGECQWNGAGRPGSGTPSVTSAASHLAGDALAILARGSAGGTPGALAGAAWAGLSVDIRANSCGQVDHRVGDGADTVGPSLGQAERGPPVFTAVP